MEAPLGQSPFLKKELPEKLRFLCIEPIFNAKSLPEIEHPFVYETLMKKVFPITVPQHERVFLCPTH